MLPSIWPGDLLTIEPAEHDEIVRGDIVVLLRNHRVFIHRVIEVGDKSDGWMCITRGDSMPQSDAPATVSDLLGKLARIRRARRSFAPSRRMSMLGSGLAWIFGRSDQVRNLALRIHAVRLRTDSAGRVDLAEDANGVICLPYISQSSSSHI